MKKFIFLVLLAVQYFTVLAAVPQWFNFQGKCDVLNDDINVEFRVYSSDGSSIYVEKTVVKTASNGAFTAQLEIANMDWYSKSFKLDVKVNGVDYANGIEFGSVPYAVQAERIGQFDTDELMNMSRYINSNREMISVTDEMLTVLWEDFQEFAEVQQNNTEMISYLSEILNCYIEENLQINERLDRLETLVSSGDNNSGSTESITDLQSKITALLTWKEISDRRMERLEDIVAYLESYVNDLLSISYKSEAQILELREITENLLVRTDSLESMLNYLEAKSEDQKAESMQMRDTIDMLMSKINELENQIQNR